MLQAWKLPLAHRLGIPKMEIKQHLKLSQQLVMTPQLQQAIKLLQLSRMELVDMVRDEMLENPILEDSVESGNEQAKAAEAAPTEGTGGDVERVGETETAFGARPPFMISALVWP